MPVNYLCGLPVHPRTMSVLLCLLLFAALLAVAHSAPNIVFILADDLGTGDIDVHTDPAQVPTPHIRALFEGGVELTQLYHQPVCSPTRASLLSGRHVIHTGIYMPFPSGVDATHLNTSYTLLPRYLQRAAGYHSHIVGKWHLGASQVKATPGGRGFDSHLGYWSGAESYINHTVNTGVWDFQINLTPAPQYNGSWSTRILADAAVSIISEQGALGPAAPPLFLYLAFQNVHWPLEAPAEYIARFINATGGDMNRATLCGQIAFLDDAVGNVTRALTAAGMDDNTVVIFASDNGAPDRGDEKYGWGNNFPLRGGKNTLFNGGVNVLGAVKGPGIPVGVKADFKIHATDWLPSLVSLATGGGDWRQWAPPGEPPYLDGDGMDVWASIASGGATPPARDWVLLETHSNATYLTHGDGLIVGDMKLVVLGPEAPAMEDGWWPPTGQNAAATTYSVACGPPHPRTGPANLSQCVWPTPCLFNITADPCEYHDLAAQLPQVVAQLQARLATFVSVPPILPEGCPPNLITIPASGGGTAQAYQPCDAPVQGSHPRS